MVVNVNIKNFFYTFFYHLDSRITELFYFSSICENDMVVLIIKIRLFVLSMLRTKLMLSDKSTI